MELVILLSNLGYLRGINGLLSEHLRYAYRHVYCPRPVQERYIKQVVGLMQKEKPDLCCFVEIDKGSTNLKSFNQLEALISDEYPFFDIENKYGPVSRLRNLPLMSGKSNGFVAKQKYNYEKIFFTHGTKRLIYKINVAPHVTLFFAHFSLKKKVRAQQLLQLRGIIDATPRQVILLGDFNVHSGFGELSPLLSGSNLVLMNRENEPTFRFHKTSLSLDLCICSSSIAQQAQLRVIPQPYSDHEALLLSIQV